MKNALLALFVLFVYSAAWSRDSFTDQNLKILLQNSAEKQTRGIIWIWSPRMVLSYMGYKEIHPISRLLDLEVTYLVDPYVSEIEIERTAISHELKESQLMKSEYLNRVGALVHYPVLILYQNGKILTPSRPGYDEPWRLYEYLARRLL